jgi:pyridoxamine 5'-phosphate oxidase
MADRTGHFAGDDPFHLARAWLAEAEKTEINDPNAIALASVDADGSAQCAHGAAQGYRGGRAGRGRLRVLHQLRQRQGREIAASGKAAFVMHWKSLRRQIRVRGAVEREDGPQADAYFASRSLKSRLGAWASRQSRPLDSRATLMAEVARVTAQQGPAPGAAAVLGRVPHPPGRDRVLGRWRVPAA